VLALVPLVLLWLRVTHVFKIKVCLTYYQTLVFHLAPLDTSQPARFVKHVIQIAKSVLDQSKLVPHVKETCFFTTQNVLIYVLLQLCKKQILVLTATQPVSNVLQQLKNVLFAPQDCTFLSSNVLNVQKDILVMTILETVIRRRVTQTWPDQLFLFHFWSLFSSCFW